MKLISNFKFCELHIPVGYDFDFEEIIRQCIESLTYRKCRFYYKETNDTHHVYHFTIRFYDNEKKVFFETFKELSGLELIEDIKIKKEPVKKDKKPQKERDFITGIKKNCFVGKIEYLY